MLAKRALRRVSGANVRYMVFSEERSTSAILMTACWCVGTEEYKDLVRSGSAREIPWSPGRASTCLSIGHHPTARLPRKATLVTPCNSVVCGVGVARAACNRASNLAGAAHWRNSRKLWQSTKNAGSVGQGVFNAGQTELWMRPGRLARPLDLRAWKCLSLICVHKEPYRGVGHAATWRERVFCCAGPVMPLVKTADAGSHSRACHLKRCPPRSLIDSTTLTPDCRSDFLASADVAQPAWVQSDVPPCREVGCCFQGRSHRSGVMCCCLPVVNKRHNPS